MDDPPSESLTSSASLCLNDLMRLAGVLLAELRGAAEEETGDVKHAVLVELSQGLAGGELDVDPPCEHFDLVLVYFI